MAYYRSELSVLRCAKSELNMLRMFATQEEIVWRLRRQIVFPQLPSNYLIIIERCMFITLLIVSEAPSMLRESVLVRT